MYNGDYGKCTEHRTVGNRNCPISGEFAQQWPRCQREVLCRSRESQAREMRMGSARPLGAERKRYLYLRTFLIAALHHKGGLIHDIG